MFYYVTSLHNCQKCQRECTLESLEKQSTNLNLGPGKREARIEKIFSRKKNL